MFRPRLRAWLGVASEPADLAAVTSRMGTARRGGGRQQRCRGLQAVLQLWTTLAVGPAMRG